jgi:hypothetical protein
VGLGVIVSGGTGVFVGPVVGLATWVSVTAGGIGGGSCDVPVAVGDGVSLGAAVGTSLVSEGAAVGGRRVRVGVELGWRVAVGAGVFVRVAAGPPEVRLGTGLPLGMGSVGFCAAAARVSTTAVLSGLLATKSWTAEAGRLVGPAALWPALLMTNCCKLVRTIICVSLSKAQMPSMHLMFSTSSRVVLGSGPGLY